MYILYAISAQYFDWFLHALFSVILYAISAVYFAGVMVRLMLTLTPVVCILAAVAFSKTFSLYLKDDGGKPAPQNDEEKEKNDKYYDKVRERQKRMTSIMTR